MYPSADNFKAIIIKSAEYLQFGESGPYRVIGIKEYFSTGNDEEVVIQDGIPNEQLAKKFLEMYLEDCVRENYFPMSGDC